MQSLMEFSLILGYAAGPAIAGGLLEVKENYGFY